MRIGPPEIGWDFLCFAVTYRVALDEISGSLLGISWGYHPLEGSCYGIPRGTKAYKIKNLHIEVDSRPVV